MQTSPTCTVAAALLAALATPALAQDLLVKAGRVVVAPGTTLENSALLVRDGKIAYVGKDIPAEARARARTVDLGDHTVSAGFVLAATTLDADADLGEGALAFTPDLRVAEAFDAWGKRLEHLAPHGVTSFGLTPSPRNVAGGIGILAKPGKDRGRVAEADAFVGFSLVRAARSQERDPTSLMGARAMLREAFDAARTGAEVGPDLAVLRQVMSGARRAVVYADTFAELNAALALGAQFNFAPVIIGGSEASKVVDKLAERSAGVVLGTMSPTNRIADLELPGKLAAAGVPFCFAGQPAQMRVSAALAVRHGLPREAAHAALTRTPATMLGRQAEVGSLRQGCSADFVVFDGDLLDLSARHVATWVDGVHVHGQSHSHSSKHSKASR
ncbi:MAG: hypothetical protein CMJ88_08245 [Planctomycetes bacterium]|nr:hypothetical protein [Planctomycetota bacterium]